MKIKVKKPVYVSCYTICRSRTKGLWLKCGCFQCPEYPVNIITKYLWKYILSLGLSFYFWTTSLNWLQWHYGCLPLRGKPIGPRANGTQNSELVNFVPSIAFTISTIRTNQFHLPKNGREGLKLVSRMASKKWNTNFHLEYSTRKNRTTFSDVPLISEIFFREHPKSRFPFTFQPDFPENYSVNNQWEPSNHPM